MAEKGIGRVIDNKYELIAALGKGGMSIVWLARDQRLDKLWAIKEVKPNAVGAQGKASRQAVVDEANFMKRLDHPAIPRVVDIIDDGQTVFVVMDYVNGCALSRMLRQQGEPFSQEDVINWGIQLCDVLGYLHSLTPPVIYRDMKPGNVILRDDGTVKLIDFGIACELLPNAAADGRRIGSPGYSAPEQIEPETHESVPTDTRADIYALGTTLYALATGITPRRVVEEDGTKRVVFDLRPLCEVNPALSEGLEQVIARATRLDPTQRYQTIEEMRHDLMHHEELTQAYRVAQQRKVDIFWARVRAACVVLAASAACIVGGMVLRNASYDELMHRASIASTEEVRVVSDGASRAVVGGADASEAEEGYAHAIEVAPSRFDAYARLLEVYKADGVFTPTEARRFARLWQTNGQRLVGTSRYARLCYDVGILYLCYYDYLGIKGKADELSMPAVTGQGAVVNATQASVWFERALEACCPDEGDYAGLEVDEQVNEYAAVQVYHTIACFHTAFSQASREGRDVTVRSQAFWDALRQAICADGDARPLVEEAEPIVQLRLYQVAFESIASPTYLSGFLRAGVDEQDVMSMLETIKGATDTLGSFVATNPSASEAIYREIEDGFDAAKQNVQRIYNGPVAKQLAGARGGR